ncbi:TIGR03571 family LLM class oxidoreductase [Halalkalicoccus ordinarius]|uniref:TIGR03571 family LLM class oxidoreductase n=1 Tax=Halalkalicoccus ordinarius TaxID=3116651 RepID=UPI003907F4C6
MNGHENRGYRRLFGEEGLTFGTAFPLTGVDEGVPSTEREMRLAAHAEGVGFDALWARDVPTYWPKFRDAGGSYDPWTWLTLAATHTGEVALGTASVVLPLRHPLHVAKSAASIDRLSDGRLLLGIASGDRPPEYDAFGVNEDERDALFRESVRTLRTVWREEFPELETRWGSLDGRLDLVPKPTDETLPLLVTGRSRQSLEWIGEHGDGWLFYHLPRRTLEDYLDDWRGVGGGKPFVMAVGVDLVADPGADPEPIEQGFRAGSDWFVEYFRDLERMGVDHVLVSVRGDDPERALAAFAEDVMDQV